MKHTAISLSAIALLAAGCGTQQATQGATSASGNRAASQSARLVAVAATPSTSRCTVSTLSLRLGPAGHAAGSTYRPIVFTNTGTTSCTLRGYPGVSYVAPRTGAQVGTAATRDPAVTPHTITLPPGGRASALLQLVNYLNYPPSTCAAKTVSGVRVYPPGSRAAAYVAFAQPQKACSSSVHQLSVRAAVKGRTGQ